MDSRIRFCRPLPLAFVLAALPGLAFSQATVKADGLWRSAVGAGASFSSGNSESSSVTLTGEAVRATDWNKWGIGGRFMHATSQGQTTADNWAVGTQYDHNFSEWWFSFAKVDYLRDKPANLASRVSASGGIGKHVIRTDTVTWDITTGLGFAADRFVTAANVGGRVRESDSRNELVFGQTSTHKFSDSTSFRQKLGLFQNIGHAGGYRAVFDAGVSVAMTSSLSLTAGLTHRYDSRPTLNLSKSDTLFVTGISVKLD
jgi:putative salt-induced outer membrane protein